MVNNLTLDRPWQKLASNHYFYCSLTSVCVTVVSTVRIFETFITNCFSVEEQVNLECPKSECYESEMSQHPVKLPFVLLVSTFTLHCSSLLFLLIL